MIEQKSKPEFSDFFLYNINKILSEFSDRTVFKTFYWLIFKNKAKKPLVKPDSSETNIKTEEDLVHM